VDDPSQHGGKRISAYRWAKDNAPVGKKWLDEHAKFARDEWDDFVIAWKWAQSKPYAPERRPSLATARDLIDAKKRSEHYHSASDRSRTPVPVEPEAQETQASAEKIVVSPAATVLCGDVEDMPRRHIADGTMDVIAADPPYFMRVPEKEGPVDFWNKRSGMTPRFRADWDRFSSLAEYEKFTEGWLREAVRCLHKDGSMFIFCSQHSIGPIARLLEVMDINVVQHIQIYKLNGRPVSGSARYLQFSHHTLIWATKDRRKYRFNGRQVKLAVWEGDPFNDTRGKMKRNIWLVPNSGHENKTGFPAQKPIEEYNRMIQMAGKTGGTMLDIFGGSGTGAVAALRWGMKFITIERDPDYVADIIKRVKAELRRKR
jgi:modification methylase